MSENDAWPELANPPQAFWTPALAPHSLENVGQTDLHVISVELKQSAISPAMHKNA
jgi:mannose-6-phosphate isomerase-like protein (cupin superfamily)